MPAAVHRQEPRRLRRALPVLAGLPRLRSAAAAGLLLRSQEGAKMILRSRQLVPPALPAHASAIL